MILKHENISLQATNIADSKYKHFLLIKVK